MAKKISVVSSITNDLIEDGDGKLIASATGGPGTYIKKALERIETPYDFFSGPVLNAEIRLKPTGEVGKVKAPTKIKKVADLNLNEWTIISTLSNEWDLSNVPSESKIFLDIQGYVRSMDNFGAKKIWNDSIEIQPKLFCLKGTEEEMKYLPKEVLERQKDKLLVITKGAAGSDIFYKRKFYHFSTTEIKDLPDTIGAGDTFLSYFVSALFKGGTVPEAGRFATKKTSEFLRLKKSSKYL